MFHLIIYGKLKEEVIAIFLFTQLEDLPHYLWQSRFVFLCSSDLVLKTNFTISLTKFIFARCIRYGDTDVAKQYSLNKLNIQINNTNVTTSFNSQIKFKHIL